MWTLSSRPLNDREFPLGVLSKTEIRNRIDECRLYCDEIDIEEDDDDE